MQNRLNLTVKACLNTSGKLSVLLFVSDRGGRFHAKPLYSQIYLFELQCLFVG